VIEKKKLREKTPECVDDRCRSTGGGTCVTSISQTESWKSWSCATWQVFQAYDPSHNTIDFMEFML
jgi:hypothetical protein